MKKISKISLFSIASVAMLTSCNLSKPTPSVDNRIAIKSLVATFVGENYNESNFNVREIEYGSDVIPTFTVDPVEATNSIAYFFTTNDSNRDRVLSSNLVKNTEYLLNYEIKNSSTYKDYATHYIAFKLIDKAPEKEKITSISLKLNDRPIELGSRNNVFKNVTKLTPTLTCNPVEALSSLEIVCLDSLNGQVVSLDNLQKNKEYKIEIRIKDVSNYEYDGNNFAYFFIEEELGTQKVEITDIKVRIQDKTFELRTFGEGHSFELGSDLTPTIITTPVVAAGYITYTIHLNDESLDYPEVTFNECVAGPEYSIHLHIDPNSNYEYKQGNMWVNFQLTPKTGGGNSDSGEPSSDAIQLDTFFNKVDQVWGVGNNGVASRNVTINGTTATLISNDITKTGAALKSKSKKAQGSFEITMRTTAVEGVCTALWLYDNDGINNWEIDIEMHHEHNILFSTWLTETNYTTINRETPYNISHNEWHTYRIDWYNGTKIEFYVDNVLWCTLTEKVPDHNMYVWIGAWYPKDWCGTPKGNINTLDIKDFKYKPF